MAAAMVVAAQQATAQSSSPLPGQNRPGTPPTTSTPPTTTAPGSTSPLPGTTAQGAAPGAADATTADTFSQVHGINVKLIQLGQLASQRGTTPNVKQYGDRIATEHQRLDQELKQMAQRRGIPLQPDQQAQAEQSTLVAQLSGLSGIQFDQAVMDLLVNEREGRVPHMKSLRDRTPGKDAELKKWLDEMEVTMEKTRNEARNVRQAVRQEAQQQQRQGRKP